MLNNLLKDPIFTVREDNVELSLSLPQLLDAMGAGRDIEFVNLRRHQHHAWFAFLVQLGGIACHRNGDESPAQPAAKWLETLLALGGGEEAWMLAVADLAKPAFMQPPVPEGTLAVLKNEVATPDALDVLIVSRNHDIKRTTMRTPLAEHWVFALVSLQTMQGFLGAGNYGVSRMNGGFASRPSVAGARCDDWSSRFVADVPRLLNHRQVLLGSDWPYTEGGASLLWLLAWDGKSSLPMTQLDPLYVEVCRRVRLQGPELTARTGASKAARIQARDRFGDTGDYWTPLRREDRKSLTVQAAGFSYKLVSDVAFGPDWLRAPGQALADNNSNLWIARVLARGQGETAGYHERTIPIPSMVRKLFGTNSGDALLGGRSRHMIDAAGIARLKVLKPAVLVQGQGAPDALNFKDARFDKMLATFDLRIDQFFFEELFSNLESTDEDAQTAWQTKLWKEIQALFANISESIPTPLARSYKARAAAERMLQILARKHLPDAFHKEEADAAHTQR